MRAELRSMDFSTVLLPTSLNFRVGRAVQDRPWDILDGRDTAEEKGMNLRIDETIVGLFESTEIETQHRKQES
jgi:hypothetical protein